MTGDAKGRSNAEEEQRADPVATGSVGDVTAGERLNTVTGDVTISAKHKNGERLEKE